MKKRKRLHIKIIQWLSTKISQPKLILILSFALGIVGGLTAVLMKTVTHFISDSLNAFSPTSDLNYLYFAFPLIGIALSVLFVKLFVKDDIVHGISGILYSISQRNGRMPAHHCYSSMVASSLTVGFGGSVGLESPAATTGAALGSNIGRWLNLNFKSTNLLIGCGAAATIGGIFSAPVAAVVFALEVLLLDLTTASIIPLLISAITGTAISYLIVGKGVIYSFAVMDPLILRNLPYYVLLGIVCGFVSVYFTKWTKKIERWMDAWGFVALRWKEKQGLSRQAVREKRTLTLQRLFAGGIIVGVLIFFFPPLYGEGFSALKSILSGHSEELANGSLFSSLSGNVYYLILYLILLLIFKVIAMAITTGSGGVGGIFAPTLFMGGITGFVCGTSLNLLPFASVSDKNFVLAGMAGVMSGVMQAPLTAIFLITEITGSHELFVPLSITAAAAYMLSKYLEPHSIYHSRLAKRKMLLTHDKDQAVLTLLNAENLIETDFLTIETNKNLAFLVDCISKSKRNIFPVIDKHQKFVGIILLDDVRKVIFQKNLYNSSINKWISPAPATIQINENMDSVMNKFEQTAAWNLPVVDNDKYVGFLSKSKILTSYRTILQELT